MKQYKSLYSAHPPPTSTTQPTTRVASAYTPSAKSSQTLSLPIKRIVAYTPTHTATHTNTYYALNTTYCTHHTTSKDYKIREEAEPLHNVSLPRDTQIPPSYTRSTERLPGSCWLANHCPLPVLGISTGWLWRESIGHCQSGEGFKSRGGTVTPEDASERPRVISTRHES